MCAVLLVFNKYALKVYHIQSTQHNTTIAIYTNTENIIFLGYFYDNVCLLWSFSHFSGILIFLFYTFEIELNFDFGIGNIYMYITTYYKSQQTILNINLVQYITCRVLCHCHMRLYLLFHFVKFSYFLLFCFVVSSVPFFVLVLVLVSFVTPPLCHHHT